MSRFLIFGATGFVGSNLTRFFLNEGNEIHVVVRKNSDFWRLRDIQNQVDILYGDLTSSRRVKSVVNNCQPEIIINAAGVVGGFDLEDQGGVVESNLEGTINLMNAFEDSNAECLLNTGSAYEYGYSKEPLKESSQGEPIGLYGITRKASTEYVSFLAKKYKRKGFTLRLFTPYGPYDSVKRLVPYTLVSLLIGNKVNIRNPGSSRDFTYIDDICKAYKIAVQNMDRLDFGEIINVGSGKPTLVKTAIEYIVNLGFDSGKVKFADLATNTENNDLIADVKKLKSLGWAQSIGFSEGLSLTKEWLKENLEKITIKFESQVSRWNSTL